MRVRVFCVLRMCVACVCVCVLCVYVCMCVCVLCVYVSTVTRVGLFLFIFIVNKVDRNVLRCDSMMINENFNKKTPWKTHTHTVYIYIYIYKHTHTKKSQL